MKIFDYLRPATVSEAIAAVAAPGAAYLAAGTDLLDLMKGGAMRPDRLVDVMRLPGLDRVERRRRRAHRRAGADRRACPRRGFRARLSGGCRSDSLRGVATGPQRRNRRRKPDAEDALQLLL